MRFLWLVLGVENAPTWCGGVFCVCSAVSYFSTRVGSIIGAGWLSFRVRDGSGRFPAAMSAVTLFYFLWWGGGRGRAAFFVFSPFFGLLVGGVVCGVVACGGVVLRQLFVPLCGTGLLVVVSFRPVSASSLHTLRCFQVWSIDPVFCGGPYPT